MEAVEAEADFIGRESEIPGLPSKSNCPGGRETILFTAMAIIAIPGLGSQHIHWFVPLPPGPN